MKLIGFDFDNPFVITRGIRISQWDCRVDNDHLRVIVNWDTKKIILKSPLFGQITSDFDAEMPDDSFENWILSMINKKLFDDIPSTKEHLI